MPYILIFVWLHAPGTPQNHIATGSVEFATYKACQAAATTMLRQAKAAEASLPMLICAAKE